VEAPQVNGTEVHDLDAFVAAVSDVADGEAVRLLLETDDGKRSLRTIEPESRFWPMEELRFADGAWTRTPL
jgi:hypothetical protein